MLPADPSTSLNSPGPSVSTAAPEPSASSEDTDISSAPISGSLSLASPSYTHVDDLSPVPGGTADLGGESSGYGEIGHLIIRNLSDVASKNPTRNNVEGITELPVFPMGALQKDEIVHSLDTLEEAVYFPMAEMEVTRDYTFNGESNCTWNVIFQSDSSKDLVDQLLDYTFYRIDYADYGKTTDGIRCGAYLRKRAFCIPFSPWRRPPSNCGREISTDTAKPLWRKAPRSYRWNWSMRIKTNMQTKLLALHNIFSHITGF